MKTFAVAFKPKDGPQDLFLTEAANSSLARDRVAEYLHSIDIDNFNPVFDLYVNEVGEAVASVTILSAEHTGPDDTGKHVTAMFT